MQCYTNNFTFVCSDNFYFLFFRTMSPFFFPAISLFCFRTISPLVFKEFLLFFFKQFAISLYKQFFFSFHKKIFPEKISSLFSGISSVFKTNNTSFILKKQNQIPTKQNKRKPSGAVTHNEATNLHILSFNKIC